MMGSQNLNSDKNRGPTELDRLTDPTRPQMIGLHRGPNMTEVSCVFVVYFIRAHLRGASFGTRLIREKHRPFTVLVMARVT